MTETRSRNADPAQRAAPREAARGSLPRHLLRPLAVTLVIVACLSATWIYLQTRTAAPPPGVTEARIGTGAGLDAAFDLIDHDGRPVTLQDFGGAPLLVMFGYTSCPDVCPTTLSRVAVALDDLAGDGRDAQAVFITVDPARDTPEMLADYVTAFHPRLTGLTGDADNLQDAARRFRVYYEKVGEGDDDYFMDHSAYVYLLGPDGDLLSYYHPDLAPETLSDDIRDRLRDVL